MTPSERSTLAVIIAKSCTRGVTSHTVGKVATRGGARGGPPTKSSAEQHREWLSLVEITGPFLSLPVLRRTWPDLDPVDTPTRDKLRRAHTEWLTGGVAQQSDRAAQADWIRYVLADLLGWQELLHAPDPTLTSTLAAVTTTVAEHGVTIAPSFALLQPGAAPPPDEPGGMDGAKPFALLGMVVPAGQSTHTRIPGEGWAATPVDRLVRLCRDHKAELGLVTDGRFWTLVYAPPVGQAGTPAAVATVTFDAVAWPESGERMVLRAFVSLLSRRRFFSVPDDETLVPLFAASQDAGEELTEALGIQVRQAVELLVAAIGRWDVRQYRRTGSYPLHQTDAHEIYRGAVSVMMRIVFLLFAEERKLLPSSNDLYAEAYSASRLRERLQQRADSGSEEELEHGSGAWHRLLALFEAVHSGIDHPRLRLPAHAGSLFDPSAHPWLPAEIDDRTVLHMLTSVQRVTVGTGASRETRTVTFRALDVEQIGYVYEGLLSFEGYRADGVVVGLIGKEGVEEEVPLANLESLAARHTSLDALAAELAETYKVSRIGTVKALQKLLTPPGAAERVEALRLLLAVTDGDAGLAERLLPFAGIIRRDLRGLPVVVLPGGLYVTESALRGSTGTHYTPQELASEVVLHALQPLVFEPGPLQTADETTWVPVSSERILGLKVADIAMGSAAFLVAAARYLADRLVEAWVREDDERVHRYAGSQVAQAHDADADPVVVEARRQIIEHCLYGVDINPMAVEMAKLSLWLVSMDPERSFTFLDDRLVAGDSLLGLTSLDQVRALHLEPLRGRLLNEGRLDLWSGRVDPLVSEVLALRSQISETDDELEKARLLAEAEARGERLRLVADLVVGAALSGGYTYAADSETRARAIVAKGDGRFGELSRLAGDVLKGEDDEARGVRSSWLGDDPATWQPRNPLHWPLAFPEVEAHGGFDAIIGNPPFLGGKKVSGVTGSDYREYLIDGIARGVRGNADLVAYFMLRAHDLLSSRGQTGLIATNTLAQGDTREVGLDQIVARGVTIRRSVKSRPWPSRSAVLEYCAIWTTEAAPGAGAAIVADDRSVAGIETGLEAASRASGKPQRLSANLSRAFQGSNIVGIGFALDRDEATAILHENASNQDVLKPFLNGEDLNGRPDLSARRWVIDFGDRSLGAAAEYPPLLEIARVRVKPQRDLLPDYKRRVRENWWKFEHQARPLYTAIAGLERVVVITLVSKTVMPMMVPTRQVFAHRLGVFATDDPAMLGLLSSAPHYWWVIGNPSTLETRVNYSPSDVFETFALPELTDELREAGDRLDTTRREIMLRRQLGLTKLYNAVFDAQQSDPDLALLREIHRDLDEAALSAYGWSDLIDSGLDYGFHPSGPAKDPRLTVGPAVQRELRDRLLELNHARYAEEVAQGLHDKGAKKSAKAARATVAAATLSDTEEGQLF